MQTKRLTFPSALGFNLSARLELPSVGTPKAFGIYGHCFSCGKDQRAGVTIARRLAEKGFAILRFDFGGLGDSGGDFKDQSFVTNVNDLLAATQWMNSQNMPPSFMIGHSLGGAAALSATAKSPQIKAVASIGAPSTPANVLHQFGDKLADIEANGQADVWLPSQQTLTISQKFLDDARSFDLASCLENLEAALMVMHAPFDMVVGVKNASEIFTPAKHPKSFVSLDKADHLLTNPADARYVADTIATWLAHHLDIEEPETVRAREGQVVVASTVNGRFQQAMALGAHRLLADEPLEVGGENTGPTPYQLLLAGLGACTSMTMEMYAERKGWDLDKVTVSMTHNKVHAADCETCETEMGKVDVIKRIISIEGNLDDEQRARLMEIADKCPVHRSLHSEVLVETEAA